MINRKKTITGLIAVAMCTSLLNNSIIPAAETNTNENTQANADLSEKDNLNNTTIVENTFTSSEDETSNELNKEEITSNSNNVENLITSTTEAAVTSEIDKEALSDSVTSDYVTIQQTKNGTITLDESSLNEEKGYFKYIIKPDDGYEIKDVIVDGESIGVYTYHEFKNLTEPGHTINAVFKEIEKHATGYIPEFVEVPYVYKEDVNNKLPLTFGLDQATDNSSYNITDKNYISSVKDQGLLGVCWTFSALGTFESSLLTENNQNNSDTYDFSENHMRYALSSDGGNTLGFDRTNDDGGNFTMALAYLTRGKMNGAVNESDDPYPSSTTSAAAKATRTLPDISGKTVQDYYPTQVIRLGNLPSGATSEEKEARKSEIKDLIMKCGSVTLSYYSNTSYYNQYTDGSGITTEAYYDPNEVTGNTNHGVSIVGWDDNYSVDNFKAGYKPSNPGAFLVKNSWGSSWGQNGYFYISYEDKNAFSEINAFKEIQNRDFFNNIYEYDTFGRTTIMGYTNIHDQYYANVFSTKKSGSEKLSAISTYCNYPNSYIKLYVSTDGGKTFTEKTASTGYNYVESKGYQIDDTGYYTFMLDTPIELNCDKFAVAIEVRQANNDMLIPLENNTNETFSSKAVIEKSSYTGADLTGLINNISNGKYYRLDTCVKAFTEDIKVDKATLTSAITDANTNKGTVVVSINGADVDLANKWVTADVSVAYTNEIAKAQAVAENASATQIEVDNAVTALGTATTTFNSVKTAGTKVIAADKSGLQTIYDAHKNDTQGNYTAATWTTFTTALTNTKTILDKVNATQDEVDTAVTSLNSAINGLTTKKSSSGGGGGGGGGSSSSGGGSGSSSSSSSNASDSSSSSDNSDTSSSKLSSLNIKILQQISTSINGKIKDSEILKTENNNSIVCTDISSDNCKIFKVITTGDFSSEISKNADTISVKVSENTQAYLYIKSINKYLPIVATKDGDTIKFTVESNKTYIVTTKSLEVINTGWNKVDTSWYMISANGSMKTGWYNDNGTWYNLSEEGIMKIGWFKDTDNKWYLLKSNGVMETGWYKDTDGKWYFLKDSGAMAANEYVNGYYLGTNGAWVK